MERAAKKGSSHEGHFHPMLEGFRARFSCVTYYGSDTDTLCGVTTASDAELAKPGRLIFNPRR